MWRIRHDRGEGRACIVCNISCAQCRECMKRNVCIVNSIGRATRAEGKGSQVPVSLLNTINIQQIEQGKGGDGGNQNQILWESWDGYVWVDVCDLRVF